MFSIIIVSWKNKEYLKKCVDSIVSNSTYTDHEIIVYNNEVDWPQNNFVVGPNIINLGNKKNIGLSKGANRAARQATKDFICLIDDDMEVLEGWDSGLLDTHLNTGYNWVCSTNIEPKPSVANISFSEWNSGATAKDWYINNSNTPLLIPKKFWIKIGGYDPDFPNVGAELGLAKKAYDKGCKVFLQTPNSLVIHHQSQSMAKIKHRELAMKLRDDTFRVKYNMTREMFLKKIKKYTKATQGVLA